MTWLHQTSGQMSRMISEQVHTASCLWLSRSVFCLSNRSAIWTRGGLSQRWRKLSGIDLWLPYCLHKWEYARWVDDVFWWNLSINAKIQGEFSNKLNLFKCIWFMFFQQYALSINILNNKNTKCCNSTSYLLCSKIKFQKLWFIKFFHFYIHLAHVCNKLSSND